MSKPRSIKILFDAGPLVNGPRTGVGKYTEGLIKELAHDYQDEVELVGHYFDFLGRKHAVNLPDAPNIRYRRTVLVPGKLLNMLRRLGFWIPFELLTKERGDFHLFPGFVGWPSLFRTPSAPVIHDITYLDYPQYVNGPARFDLKTLMPGMIRRAAFIIAISGVTASGLRRAYGGLQKKILVEHVPPVGLISVTDKRAREILAEYDIDVPYILAFGTLEPRKNLVSLLNAYAALPEKLRHKYGLVLSGGKGWYDADILRTINELRTAGFKVFQTGYVSDEARAALYCRATIYVLPSIYEGFGMQTMEAMIYKTPMIASDIPVLHEIAAEAAVYCDPASVASITQQLERLLNDRSLRSKLVKSGTVRLKDFSWHTVTTELMANVRESVERT